VVRVKTRILRRLGLVPIKRLYQLIDAHAEDRLRVAAESWANGFESGAESRRWYEEAA
jgi:hypothetical protein